MISNLAISTAKLAAGAVTSAKIQDTTIITSKIKDANITTSKLAADAVTSAKILDGTIATSDLSDASVTDAKITTVSGSKVTGDISGNAVNVPTAERGLRIQERRSPWEGIFRLGMILRHRVILLRR